MLCVNMFSIVSRKKDAKSSFNNEDKTIINQNVKEKKLITYMYLQPKTNVNLTVISHK